ncbi:NUDIX domain-containing protein [Microvirga pakistanensis]|uniref:NUDIX domain-containing protein n=1 Tax=Microvirga pakistanensis TaxID=1682650 RepID=UPI001FCE42F6|nr:NUDIX hydrolase [Microvirga pakistanensis]
MTSSLEDANERQPDIATVGSRIVYENKWMTVREDQIRRRDGSLGIYGVVDKPDFVIIVPVEDGIVHLVQQYRYPIGRRQWEFPQGSWEGQPGADPRSLARGELEEETGLLAGDIQEVGQLYPLYGTVTQSYRIFLATDLKPGRRRLEQEEQDLVTGAFPLAEVETMILNGTIQDAGTVASFGILRLKRLI